MQMRRDERKKVTDQIFRILEGKYPKVEPFLHHTNAFTLLVAVMLSAQCTDKMVNKVTADFLFTNDTPELILRLGEEELKKYIRRCGFFNAKARNIILMSEMLIRDFNGAVPSTLDELVQLPGVGRKTASVVLCQWFKIPAVPVDTHIHRVSNRLGICRAKTPEKTEMEFRKNVNEIDWIDGHLRLILLGRELCFARKPNCAGCPLKGLCKSSGV